MPSHFEKPGQSPSPVVEAEQDDAPSSPTESIHSEQNLDSTATSATDIEVLQTVKTDEKKNSEDESLPEHAFDSPANRVLFDAIDQFQSCGAGEFVDIPQLVIVGAQSVGKSSLLQSLTDIPFPIGEDCCTRFATRIVSRRTAPNTANKIVINIEAPNFKTTQFGYPKNNNYLKFHKERQTLTASEFAEFMDEASEEYLGIRPGKGRGRKNFAVEVLKIEVSGPNRSYFSILDIPGIFVNDYNVCDGEMDAVRNMAIEYMKQPESIVICVADACFDLSNQEIFKLANKHVDKTRLIGVFTKCDRTEKINSVVDVANGKVDGVARLLHHGWFVVRNKIKADEADPDFNLQTTEGALFGKQPWTTIRETRRGSDMLKKYLGKLLCEKIQVAFPILLNDLRHQLKETEAAETNLGPARNSSHERRAYLIKMAGQYSDSATKALENPWLLPSPKSRARQIVSEANAQFSEVMRDDGHAYSFQDHNLEMDTCLERMRWILFPHTKPKKDPSPFSSAPFRSPEEEDDEEDEEADDNGKKLFQKIEEEVAICSSTQLPGMVHPDVIQRLYKVQTSLWHRMASDHVERVASALLSAAEELLNAACPSSGSTSLLHGELLLVVRQFHDESLQKALRVLADYCQGDRTKLLQTTDPSFVHRLQLMRSLRMVMSMETATTLVKSNEKTHTVEQLGILLFEHCHHSAVDNTVNDVHDTVKVYYEFSLQSFIRHVTNTIVEDFVTDASGSLKGLCSSYMYGLSEADVNRLGGENRDVVQERELLRSRIETLRSVEMTARTAMATAIQQA